MSLVVILFKLVCIHNGITEFIWIYTVQFLLFLDLADSFPQPWASFHAGELSDFEETIKK